MNNMSFKASSIIFISIITIILTIVIVLSIGQNAFIDELLFSISLLSLFLFIFLFYGFYRGIYIKSDINYKININRGSNYIKKGFRYIYESFGFDFPVDLDIPIINIIFAVIGFILFIIFLIALLIGLSIFVYGTLITIPCIIYYIFFKAYKNALKHSKATANSITKSILYSFFYMILYNGCFLVIILIIKYFMSLNL